jgi:hypothetical protein
LASHGRLSRLFFASSFVHLGWRSGLQDELRNGSLSRSISSRDCLSAGDLSAQAALENRVAG